MPNFSQSSLDKLKTCDIRLQAIAHEAINEMDFTVICGRRGEDEQNAAFDTGHSKLRYPNSRHNSNPSEAMDLAPIKNGTIDWNDIQSFHTLWQIIKRIGNENKTPMEWGGEFKTLRDYDHFQLRA